jgi:VIT1/CCC1 family predicted Fe2+/Mn2+ transporter
MTPDRLDHDHSPEAIRHRLAEDPHVSYLRDWIYGGIDGAVTTFAVVSGVVGAALSPVIIVILGVANLLADGFSMAASNFSGTRAELEDYERLRAIEKRHIERDPEGERREIREIYRKKGFAGADLERAVEVITADRDRWIDTMLREEYGLPHEVRSARLAALSTFSAFLACGAVPLLPYLLPAAWFGSARFALSSLLTGLVFFGIGAARSRWSLAPWWRAGLETFATGGVAAVLAYGAGWALRRLIDGS